VTRHVPRRDETSTILDTWKLLAAVAVLAPRTPRVKEWAYAGMVFDLTGAAASRLVIRDAPVTIAIPLIIVCVVVVSWRLRPRSRRLAAATPTAGGDWFDAGSGFVGAAHAASNP
jgi:hypothetical protein